MSLHLVSSQSRAAADTAALSAGLLIAQQVAGKALRDTVYLLAWDVTTLPRMVVAAAVVAVLTSFLASASLGRHGAVRVVRVALLVSAALLLVEWWLRALHPGLAAVLLYLHMAVYGTSLISAFWATVNERFDPHAARRLMGRIANGATVGGLVGGLLALAAASLLKPEQLLLVFVLLHVLALMVVNRLGRVPQSGARHEPAQATAAQPEPPPARRRQRRYLLALAAVVALASAASILLDYALKEAAVARYAGGDSLLRFFSLFHTGVAVLSLASQSLFARRALERLGLALTVSVRPLVVALGGLLSVLGGGLPVLAGLRGLDAGLQNSLFRSAYELFYTPLPRAQKRAKVVIDVAFDRLGEVLGSSLLLLLLALGSQLSSHAAVLASVPALLSLALAPRLHRGYLRALATRMQSDGSELLERGSLDALTLHTIADGSAAIDRNQLLRAIEEYRGESASGDADPLLRAISDLRSRDPERVERALSSNPELDPALVAHLVPLLGVDRLYRPALKALRQAAPRVCGQLLDVLTDPQSDPVVRRRIPMVLRVLPRQPVVDALLEVLGEPSFRLRERSARVLRHLRGQQPELRLPQPRLLWHARHQLERLAAQPEDDPDQQRRGIAHAFTLLSLAFPDEPVELAWKALGGDDDALLGTSLEYLETLLPDDLSATLTPLLSQTLRGAPSSSSTRKSDLLAALREAKRRKPGRSRSTAEPRKPQRPDEAEEPEASDPADGAEPEA